MAGRVWNSGRGPRFQFGTWFPVANNFCAIENRISAVHHMSLPSPIPSSCVKRLTDRKEFVGLHLPGPFCFFHTRGCLEERAPELALWACREEQRSSCNADLFLLSTLRTANGARHVIPRTRRRLAANYRVCSSRRL
jgi:hypothetical protein